MDVPVGPPDESVEHSAIHSRFDSAVPDGRDDALGRRFGGVHEGVGTTDLDGVVGVAPADQRQVVTVGQFSDPLLGSRVFAVDLDSVEVGVDVPNRAVAVRVGDDGRTPAVVSYLDGLLGREFAGVGSTRRVRPDAEDVAVRGRHLDSGNRPREHRVELRPGAAAGSTGAVVGPSAGAEVELAVVVVVSQRHRVEASQSGDSREQSNAYGVEVAGGALVAVEEPSVGVQIDGVHGRSDGPVDLWLSAPYRVTEMTGDAGVAGDLAATDPPERDRALILNPISGDGGHRGRVRELADEHGFTVLETQAGDEAFEFARLVGEAGTDLVAAAGGDGTLNAVACGLDDVDALDEVTLGVVPVGTGNNLAGNVGIESVEHAFEVLERGERRRIDVGTGNGQRFLNSCVAGLTADASASTTPELKEKLGVLAYVVTGLRAATEFDALPLSVSASAPEGDQAWSGEAVAVLVGNVRRFPASGRSQANCEDGLLDVTIVERMPPRNLLEEATVQRLFGDETEHVTHLTCAELDVTVKRDEPVEFSFDGEMGAYRSLTMSVRPKAMTFCVGEAYEPNP